MKAAWERRKAAAAGSNVTIRSIVDTLASLKTPGPQLTRATLLADLQRVIAERDAAYGGPLFGMSAQAALARAFWDSASMQQRDTAWGACLDMALMKLARIASAPDRVKQLNRDHVIDAINYLAMSLEVAEPTTESPS